MVHELWPRLHRQQLLQVQQRQHPEDQDNLQQELWQQETRTDVERALRNMHQLLQVQQREHPDVQEDLSHRTAQHKQELRHEETRIHVERRMPARLHRTLLLQVQQRQHAALQVDVHAELRHKEARTDVGPDRM